MVATSVDGKKRGSVRPVSNVFVGRTQTTHNGAYQVQTTIFQHATGVYMNALRTLWKWNSMWLLNSLAQNSFPFLVI